MGIDHKSFCEPIRYWKVQGEDRTRGQSRRNSSSYFDLPLQRQHCHKLDYGSQLLCSCFVYDSSLKLVNNVGKRFPAVIPRPAPVAKAPPKRKVEPEEEEEEEPPKKGKKQQKKQPRESDDEFEMFDEEFSEEEDLSASDSDSDHDRRSSRGKSRSYRD